MAEPKFQGPQYQGPRRQSQQWQEGRSKGRNAKGRNARGRSGGTGRMTARNVGQTGARIGLHHRTARYQYRGPGQSRARAARREAAVAGRRPREPRGP